MNIKQFKDDYYIGEDGSVFKKLKPYTASNGYLIFKDKDGVHHLVHRLVAQAFIEQPEGKEYVDHIDDNRSNNDISNLRWCTQAENLGFSYAKGKSPIRFYKECELFHRNRKVGRFPTRREAARFAATQGAKYSMLEKHRKHNDWEIRCIDYPVGE